MEENEQNGFDIQNEEDLVLDEEPVEQPKPKKEFTVEQKLARINRMKERLEKELGIEPRRAEPQKVENKAGELDKADYAYLTAKGIEDEQRIDFLKDMMKKMDGDIKTVLKDEYVLAKLKAMETEQALQNALPSGTKTKVGSMDNLDYWVARFEQTNELPEDFNLRSAVVNKIHDKESMSKPAWHK